MKRLLLLILVIVAATRAPIDDWVSGLVADAPPPWNPALSEAFAHITRAMTSSAPSMTSQLFAASAAAAVAIAFLSPLRDVSGKWATLLHESGHAVAARAVGARVHGLRVFHDSSGVTQISGASRFGSALISVSGYAAPIWVGALTLAALASDRFGAVVVVAGAMAGVLLVWARSWRAAVGLLGVAAGAVAYVWLLPRGTAADLALFGVCVLAWIAVLAGVRDWWQERLARRRGAITDMSNLARTTRLSPTAAWVVIGLLSLLAVAPLARAVGAAAGINY